MNDEATNADQAPVVAAPTVPRKGESRRGFFELLIGIFGSLTAIGMVYPVGMYLWPRGEKQADGAVRSMQIPLAEAPIGEAKFIRFLNKPTVIIRPNEQEIVALSAICTHLGCVVKWDENSSELVCPVMGGSSTFMVPLLAAPPRRRWCRFRQLSKTSTSSSRRHRIRRWKWIPLNWAL
jgi:cytochrome b6-f complex iron-sulfur subunit